MKFISIKDPHLSFGFQNQIRNNYEQAIRNKLEFIKNYCQDNQIKNIVFTGDVFDSSTEDKWSFKKYRKNKRELERFTKSNILLYSNVGNHDMFHGLESSDNTIFGEMVHDNILNNITKKPLVETYENSIIEVQGIDYSINEDTILNAIKTFNNLLIPGKKHFKIAILHSNITPNEVHNITNFTYSKLAEDNLNINVFICGHYHLGYPTQDYIRSNGTSCKFINNWNLTRVVRDYEVRLDEHIPEFEHIEIRVNKITNEFEINTKTIKIPCGSYNEAFKLKEMDLLKKNKGEISEFFKNINIEDAKLSSKKTDTEILDVIKKQHSYKDSSYAKSIEYLNDAKL